MHKNIAPGMGAFFVGDVMKIAAAYVRVSTDKQDEYSLDAQLRLIRDYAAQRDIVVPPEFVFVEDGISGRRADKRPAFQRMIGHAKAGDFELILVWKFSRFARNQEESILYKSMLSRSGVEVISVSETLDDSPFSSLIERIIEWMDEFYSIRLSGEVKRGMDEKLLRGEVVAGPPFGYSMENKNYVPNELADIVRKIYADFLAGKGTTAITRELNLMGITSTRGNKMDNRYIKYILRNPVYIGKIRWSKDGRIDYVNTPSNSEKAVLVDGHFAPIIDVDIWEAVQKKLDHQRRSRPYTRHDQTTDWMLKGLCRCSECGSTLVYQALAAPSMQCHKYARGQCKTSHSLSLTKANATIVDALRENIELNRFPLSPDFVKPSVQGKDYDKLIAAELMKLKRVLSAYEAGVDTLEEYAAKKKKLTAAIDELEAEKAAAEKAAALSVEQIDIKAKALEVLELIQREDISEAAKNAALRSILSHIVYEKAAKRLALYFIY